MDIVGCELGTTVLWWQNRALLACREGEHRRDDRIGLEALPDSQAGVAGWQGTDDDSSTARLNTVTMPGALHEATTEYLAGCFALTTAHSGDGTDPVPSPSNSPGCGPGTFVVGEAIALTAAPDPGWSVASWFGTLDDLSQATDNSLAMPAGDAFAAVEYVDACHTLAIGHTGPGTNPVPAPPSSDGCSLAEYVAGEVITLTAQPDPGAGVEAWFGTDDDASRAVTNRLTMPEGDTTAGVAYVDGACQALSVTHTGAWY